MEGEPSSNYEVPEPFKRKMNGLIGAIESSDDPKKIKMIHACAARAIIEQIGILSDGAIKDYSHKLDSAYKGKKVKNGGSI